MRSNIHRKLRRAGRGKSTSMNLQIVVLTTRTVDSQWLNDMLHALAGASYSDLPHSLDPCPLLSLACVQRRNEARGPMKKHWRESGCSSPLLHGSCTAPVYSTDIC